MKIEKKKFGKTNLQAKIENIGKSLKNRVKVLILALNIKDYNCIKTHWDTMRQYDPIHLSNLCLKSKVRHCYSNENPHDSNNSWASIDFFARKIDIPVPHFPSNHRGLDYIRHFWLQSVEIFHQFVVIWNDLCAFDCPGNFVLDL